jgi:eukaryotic-like serine/threonine-protein kinase
VDRAVLLTVNGRRGHTVTDGREIVIGRAADSDLRLTDERVSRRHCLIKTDEMTVRDLSSRHGTLLDGVPVTEHALTDGAQLRLGDTTISVAVVPAHFPGLVISHEIGRGAQGTVFLAHDPSPVALKVLSGTGMPLRELSVMRALRHPHIVEFRSAGVDPVPHIVSAWCPDGNITRLGVTPPARAVPLMIGVLDALVYAHGTVLPDVPLADGTTHHARGIVHRDIKPENVLLAGDIAKVADFGLAKAYELAGRSGHTRTGERGGSVGFMPRAQLYLYREADPSVDTWAAAATLYWLLTGHPPRDFAPGCDPIAVIMRDDPIPLADRGPGLPPALTALIDEALSETRPMLAVELRDALHAARSAWR